jgi:hypothetical protein
MPPDPIGTQILNYCVALDRANDPVMNDCNAFVKKVAGRFGVPINPNFDADEIVEAFPATPFTKTTTDPATAMLWANDGLVVAGMTLSQLEANPSYGSHTNGHVAIVHPAADTAHPGFPMASWGVLGSRGTSNTSIRWSFPAAACEDKAVQFAFAPTE